jgi:hypothetical protein
MNKNQIEVGKTYRNKGPGGTEREVLGIGNQYRPNNWYRNPPNEPGVFYRQTKGPFAGETFTLFLSSFAKWAGKEAKP